MANGDEGQQAGQEGGVQITPKPPEDTGPTIQDTLRDLGQQGGVVEAEPESEHQGGQPAEQEPEPDQQQPADQQQQQAPAELPEGFTEEGDRIRGPDGRFYAREDVLEEGADASPLPTEEEAEDFFEGEEPEPEHTVEIELESEGEEPEVLEIGTDDEDTAERIRQMQEDAREVRELRAQVTELEETRAEVQRDLQQAELLEQEIRMDPAGFVVERLPEDRKAQVVEDVLLEDDEVYEQIMDRLDEWARDPTTRREKRLDRREQRDQMRKELEQRREKAQAAAQTGQTVAQALQDAIPEDMSAKRAQMFLRDAVRDIQEYVQENGIGPRELTVDMVPEIIQHRLEVYGIDWQDRRTMDRRSSSEPRTAKPAGEEEADMARKAEEARKTGERLRKAYARRRKAGQSAPAGQGSPGTTTRPPSDATLDEALDAMRRRAAG